MVSNSRYYLKGDFCFRRETRVKEEGLEFREMMTCVNRGQSMTGGSSLMLGQSILLYFLLFPGFSVNCMFTVCHLFYILKKCK